jgi:predicted Zn-dependent protease
VVAEGEQSVNAGATFGLIMVTTGMLHFARTDDELAAVLGHELGHHTQSHISKGLRLVF